MCKHLLKLLTKGTVLSDPGVFQGRVDSGGSFTLVLVPLNKIRFLTGHLNIFYCKLSEKFKTLSVSVTVIYSNVIPSRRIQQNPFICRKHLGK